MLIPPKKNKRTKGKSTVDKYLTRKEQRIMDWYNSRREKKEPTN